MAELDGSTESAAPAKKGGLKKIILFLVLFLIVGGAGVGVYLIKDKLFGGEESKDGTPLAALEDKKKENLEPPKATGFLLPVSEIKVNLAEEGAYIVVTLQLEVHDQITLDMGKLRMPMIRDAILMVVTTKTTAEIREDSQNSYIKLKGDILSRLSSVMGEGAVERVFIESIMITG